MKTPTTAPDLGPWCRCCVPDLLAINHGPAKRKSAKVMKACEKEPKATGQPEELSFDSQLEFVDVKSLLIYFI